MIEKRTPGHSILARTGEVMEWKGPRSRKVMQLTACGILCFLDKSCWFFRIHHLIPASEVFQTGQSCLSAEQVVAEYAVKIVIDEQRAIG